MAAYTQNRPDVLYVLRMVKEIEPKIEPKFKTGAVDYILGRLLGIGSPEPRIVRVSDLEDAIHNSERPHIVKEPDESGLLGPAYPLKFILDGLAMCGLVDLRYEGVTPPDLFITGGGYAALEIMRLSSK